MTYTTVFDAAHQGYTTWWFPAFGLIFLTIGALFVFRRKLADKLFPGGLQGRARRGFGYFFLGFAILWTVINFIVTYSQYRRVTEAFHDGNYSVIEGPVSNFIPMPYGGHAMESFCVQDECFSYSDYGVTPGFHNTASHGGPIREGLNVRVTYIGNVILRLEVGH